jgi:hypothetical protein
MQVYNRNKMQLDYNMEYRGGGGNVLVSYSGMRSSWSRGQHPASS